VLEDSGYRRKYAHATPEEVRRLVVRRGLTAADIPVWMGILRQVLWKLRGSAEL